MCLRVDVIRIVTGYHLVTIFSDVLELLNFAFTEFEAFGYDFLKPTCHILPSMV